MSVRHNWLPNEREKVLEMCKAWLDKIVTKVDVWNIRKGTPEKLQTLFDAATASLAVITKKGDKSPNKVAKSHEDFEALINFMQEIKMDAFHGPLLLEEDYADLMLKMHDDHPTPSGIPLASAYPEIGKKYRDKVTKSEAELGVGVMMIKAVYVGNKRQAEPQNRQFCFQYIILPQGELPPEDFELWPGMVIMTKHRHTLDTKVTMGTLHGVIRVMNGEIFGAYSGPVMHKNIS
jgi:hypothetical protein